MQVLDGFQNILALAQEKDSQGAAGMGSGGGGEMGSGGAIAGVVFFDKFSHDGVLLRVWLRGDPILVWTGMISIFGTVSGSNISPSKI
jgi:hypothetical protein